MILMEGGESRAHLQQLFNHQECICLGASGCTNLEELLHRSKGLVADSIQLQPSKCIHNVISPNNSTDTKDNWVYNEPHLLPHFFIADFLYLKSTIKCTFSKTKKVH